MQKTPEYDQKAEKFNWRGPEIIFGLAYDYLDSRGSLLDLGIGTGLSSVLFAKRGMNIYGMDNSREMLNICADKNIASDLKQHDLLSFPYPYDASFFNCVLALSVFMIFKDLKPIFKEISRLLVPGGLVGFTAEDIKPGQDAAYLLDPNDHSADPNPATAITLYRHGCGYLCEALSEYGLEIKKWIEFLVYQSPDRKRDIYYTAYIARKV